MREEHLIREFIAEAEEHLSLLEPQLLRLEKEPDNADLVQNIFLATHGIKGTASYVGLTHISDFTHALESLLDRLRKRELHVCSDLIDLLLEGVDQIKRLIQHVGAGQPAPDTSDIERRLVQWITPKENIANTPNIPPAPLSDMSAPLRLDDLHELDPEDGEIFADIANQQIECMTLSLEQMQEVLTTIPKASPEQISPLAESFMKAFNTLQTSAAMLNIDALDTLLAEQHQHVRLLTPPHTVTQQRLEMIERVLTLLRQVTETIAQCSQSAPLEQPPPSEIMPSEEMNGALTETLFGLNMLRVDAERVDALLQLVGELVTNRARLVQVGQVLKNLHEDLRSGQSALFNPSPGHRKKTTRLFKRLKETLDEVTTELGRLTNQFQEGTMRIRMIPISQVVGRFPRMVRDLSRQSGKQIHVEIHGADTELDKSVMDVLADPLIHILRNAVDHGIELPAERQTQGKPPQGTITISASHQGNQVVINIHDDGRGVDVELVKHKAIEHHVLTPQQANALSDKELTALIFHPGLSTVEATSSLSGRGVGLHIVKRYLEQLNGTIVLKTSPGQGCTFTIKLPLTLAIIPALLVSVKSEVFAIPLVSVEEVVRVAIHDINTIDLHQVIRLRDTTIPLVALTDVFGEAHDHSSFVEWLNHKDLLPYLKSQDQLEDFSLGQDENQLSGVIISDGVQQFGVIIDDVIGESDIVITPLDNDLVNVDGISGASIQGDGRVALVLDAAAFIQLTAKRLRQLKRETKTVYV